MYKLCEIECLLVSWMKEISIQVLFAKIQNTKCRRESIRIPKKFLEYFKQRTLISSRFK